MKAMSTTMTDGDRLRRIRRHLMVGTLAGSVTLVGVFAATADGPTIPNDLANGTNTTISTSSTASNSGSASQQPVRSAPKKKKRTKTS
jgi:hypothetical protein